LGSVLFFGARSGHGLWKSTNYGATWTNVTTLPNTGPYVSFEIFRIFICQRINSVAKASNND
jgi:hypothetical protein